jgi:hypothetical protein
MDTELTVREVIEDSKLRPGRASVLVRLLDSQVRKVSYIPIAYLPIASLLHSGLDP